MKHLYKNIRLALTLAAALAGIPAAQAGTEQAVRTYDTSALRSDGVTAEGVQYTRLSWEGLEMTAAPGEPELPVEYVRFLVPVYTTNFTASVSGVTHGSTLQTMYRIYPGQEPVTTNHEGPVPFTAPLESAYTLMLPVRAEVVSDGFVDGCNHIVTVAVYPTTYSPSNGTVMPASHLTVTLNYDDCTAADLKDTPIFPPHRSRHIDVGDMVVNAQRMSSRQYAPAAAPLDTMCDRYYIITPRSLAASFRDLAAWKRQKGYDVVIKPIEEVYEQYPYGEGQTHSCQFAGGGTHSVEVVDEAASLRTYLQDEFSKHGSFFCLLAGDYRTPMPIRKVYSSTRKNEETFEYYSNYNGENFIPTDNYFSDFTSDWTLGSYMECDYKTTHYSSCKYNPDIAIGRLLCSKPEEVRNYVYKLKIYEAYPGRGNDDYLSKAFYFEDGNLESGSMLGAADIVMAKFNPFESTVVLKDSCSYGRESLPHKANDVINNMRRVGFSSLHGHGSPSTIECCHDNGQFIVPLDWYSNAETALNDWADRNRVAGRGFDSLNNKDFPSIAYSISCTTAPFDKYEYGIEVYDSKKSLVDHLNGGHVFDMPYNFGSSFTVAGDFGGPAYLANTRSGLVISSTNLEVKWGELTLNNPKIGIAEARSKFLCSSSYLRAIHQLIGEPEFEMWLGKPGRMETNVESTDFSVHLTSSELAGATVCLFDGYDKRVLRNISGTDISLKLISLSHYTLSVWKPGFLPFIRFYGAHGTLSDFDEKFIVLDAEIGEQYTGTLSAGRAFCVGSNAKLTIEAMKAVNVNRSCIIDDGGVLTIAGDDKVTLNCTVKRGGKLKVTAKSIQMGSGFTVEPGGTLDIQYK